MIYYSRTWGRNGDHGDYGISKPGVTTSLIGVRLEFACYRVAFESSELEFMGRAQPFRVVMPWTGVSFGNGRNSCVWGYPQGL
jgi:hypothetical protein